MKTVREDHLAKNSRDFLEQNRATWLAMGGTLPPHLAGAHTSGAEFLSVSQEVETESTNKGTTITPAELDQINGNAVRAFLERSRTRPLPHASETELISLAREVEIAQQRMSDHNTGTGTATLTDDQLDALCEDAAALAERLTEMKAASLRSILAKAKAAQIVMRNAIAAEPGSTVENSGEYHDLLVWSLLNDLVAFHPTSV